MIATPDHSSSCLLSLATNHQPLVTLRRLLTSVALTIILTPTTAMSDQANTERAEKFVSDHTERLRPLEIAAGLAWWEANTTGKDEAFAKKAELENKIDAQLSSPQHFAAIKAIKTAGGIDNAVLNRSIAVSTFVCSFP